MKKNTTSKPFISFIIPAYNAEKSILNCIKSIINQDFDDYEMIIIDDGSTDSTKKIIESVNDKRIKYYFQENSGVSSARNSGLSVAAGEWIHFVDSDDTVAEKSISYFVDLISKEQPDIIITPIEAFEKDEDRINAKDGVYLKSIEAINDIIYRLPDRPTTGMTIVRNLGGNLIRKSIIDKNNIRFCDGLRFFEDGIFNISVMVHTDKILYSNTKLYNYSRDNKTSRMNTLCTDIIQDNKTIHKSIKRILDKSDIDSRAFPYLEVELFSTSLFALAMKKERLRNKVKTVKEYQKYFFRSPRDKISKKLLSKVLRAEYALCHFKMYRILLVLCRLKGSLKHLRGRI